MVYRVILFSFLFAACSVQAVELSQMDSRTELGPHLEILSDPDGILTIDDVSDASISARFDRHTEPLVNLGFVEGVVWLRFRLTYSGDDPMIREIEFDNRFVHNVQLYSLAENGEFAVVDLDGKGFYARPFIHRSVVFPLEILPDTNQTYYVRVRSESPLRFSLIAWAPGILEQSEFMKLMGLGLFLGGLAAMALYHFIMVVSVKERIYFYFALFLGFGAICQAHIGGVGFWLFWSEQPEMVMRAMLFTSGTMMAFSVLFTRRYLQSKEFAPKWDDALLFLTAACVVQSAIALSSPTLAMKTVFPVGFLWPVICFGVSAQVWQKNISSSTLFLVMGWGAMSIGTVGNLLVNLALFSSNAFTDRVGEVGFGIATVAFAIGLAVRTKVSEESAELELQEEVEKLEGFLPICAFCKKIRNEDGEWFQLEKYIRDRTDVEFDHVFCPDCRDEYERVSG